jgi:hypothetical protein
LETKGGSPCLQGSFETGPIKWVPTNQEMPEIAVAVLEFSINPKS